MKDSYLKLRISDEEYIKFQEVCEAKGKTMSEVLRSFISSYTNSQNLVLLDVDKETLKKTTEMCREKKIKFNALMKFLLLKALKNKDKLNFQ
jgi:antitoxin component of RelBE/YafQ-DinJ toxin-antitoxin module